MSSAEIYNKLAWTLYHNDESEKAQKYFNRALKLSPTDTKIISNCGEFAYKTGKYDDALDYFLRALSLDEENPQILYKIACCLIRKNLLNDALAYLNKAIFYDENNTLYYQEAARIYYKKEDMNKAKKVFEKIIQLDENNTWAYSNLGNIYLYQYSDVSSAYICYQKAYESNPNYSWGFYNLANVKVMYKEYNEALDLYKTACEIEPDNTLFLLALAQGYYRIGYFENAIEKYSMLLEKDETNYDAALYLAKIYLHEKKDMIKSKYYFEKAININPTSSLPYYGLAKIYFLDFDKKNAMINISMALEFEENNDKFKALKNCIDELKEE